MRFRPFLICVASFSCGISASWSQVYAPDTQFHDRAQRHFVVELARILAWRENQGNPDKPKVAEITYDVSISNARQTTWNVHWLDSAGLVVRDWKVAYPEALLTSAAFYKTVSDSMFAVAPPSWPDTLSKADVGKEYWAGADLAGFSRAESLRAAFAITPTSRASATRLAGLLAHAAVPGIDASVSLDCVLLARAAAWLCIAGANSESDSALWAPILFLSGRETAASAAWKMSPPTVENDTTRWWRFMLSRPKCRAAFEFCAEPANKKMAVPTLVYYGRLLALGETVSEVIRTIYDTDEQIGQFHDYAHFFQSSGVGAGRMLEGAWPALSRAAWVRCMRAFQPEALDFKQWKEELKGIGTTSAEDPDDASLTGLGAAAPLINLGFTEGVGKATPVAAVTARDLLNFGWEMCGLQMGARWRFVKDFWGVRDLSDAIAKATLASIDGSEGVLHEFPYGYQPSHPPETWQFIVRERLTNFARLQEVDGAEGEWVVPFKVFSKNKAENSLAWITGCWLRPSHILDQGRELYFSGRRKDIAPLLRRQRAEGGPLTDEAEISFFENALTPVGTTQCPGTDALRLDLIASQAEPSGRQIAITWDLSHTTPPLEKAQSLEKIFWQRPGGDLPFESIFSLYVKANAYEAAKRFYGQAEEFIDEDVRFSNGMGPRRFTLALLQDDEPAMQEALKASATGSFTDMVLEMMRSVAQEDFSQLERQVNECLDRYPEADEQKRKHLDYMSALKGFLPLIPALLAPENPQHATALDYFAKWPQWPTLQWLLIQQAKLPVEEAVRFLGGKGTDPQRRMLVACLLKDKDLFTKTYDEFEVQHTLHWTTMAYMLIHYVRNELLDMPKPAAQPDLKPPEVESPWQAFLERRHRIEDAGKKEPEGL